MNICLRIDRRPKFHLYQPNIALISGIAWDHINVFPTYENYVDSLKFLLAKLQMVEFVYKMMLK
jgi:UDP-N-acetylmuramate: L-alanyl-gamma-D-glutamyl-meso-diaminopimelate ligase